MRRLILCGTLIVGVLATRFVTAQNVQPRSDSGKSDTRSADFPNVFVGPPTPGSGAAVITPPQSAPADPPPPARQRAAADRDRASRGDQHAQRHHHHGGRTGPWFGGGFPWIWSGGYTPAFSPYYPSYTYFGYNVASPFVVYDPVPVNVAPAAPAVRAANDPAANNVPAADPAPPKVKSTHAEQKARAGRFITFGDTNFAEQRYLAASERYKTAIEIAPDVAESYFRQAFALVALGQYPDAATAFRRGLRIRSDWSGAPFRLDQIYGAAPLAKTQHVENLAKAVEANPFDSDLLLVLGMELFFDGQPDRSGVCFTRSGQLGGNDDRLLDAFLANPKPGGAADPQPAGGKIRF